MRSSVLKSAALLGLLAGPAAAMADPPPVQDWTTETIIVTARKPGPLLWKVHRGAGEVYILAVVGPMPDDLAWDHSRLDQILDGARAVMLQPQAQIGILEGAWFLLTERSSLELPDGEHLETVLDPALRDRFVRAREKLHRDPGRYEDYLPAWAGFRLFGDFLDAEKLEAREPSRTIERIADHKDVPAKPIATYEALPVVRDVRKMSDTQSRTCLKSALDDIEAEEAHQKAAAEAWALGDLDGMKANYSEATMFACLQAVPKFATLWKQSVDDTTRAADEALAAGGKSVLVTNLGVLLRKDGILDRLRAQGVTIDDPE
jgi:hypothetical protein